MQATYTFREFIYHIYIADIRELKILGQLLQEEKKCYALVESWALVYMIAGKIDALKREIK